MTEELKKAEQIAEEHFADQPLSKCILEIVKHLKSEKQYGYYQLCPKCDGRGEFLAESGTAVFVTCPVCEGKKLIPRPEIKEQ